jgi:tryptophan synthase beta subunit
MSKIDIKGAFETVKESISGIMGIGILTAITVIILGVLVYAVTSGSITLSTALNTLLNTFDASFAGWITTAVAVVATVVGLVVVVVIVKLFQKYMGGKKGDAM